MKKWRCGDPRMRALFLLLLVLAVFVAALFLYIVGLMTGAGFVYSIAVLLLLLFAVAGAIALAFLTYSLYKRWCERRGKPPKGQGTRENSGSPSVHLPSTIYKRRTPTPRTPRPCRSPSCARTMARRSVPCRRASSATRAA